MKSKRTILRDTGVNLRVSYSGALCVNLKPEEERVLARLAFETGLSKGEIMRKGLEAMGMIHNRDMIDEWE